MSPRTRELLDHLAAQRTILRSAFDAVPAALRTRCPAPDRWSCVGVIEHLALAEARIAGALGEGLAAARAADRTPPLRDDTPVLPKLDPTAILDRERTVAAREAIRPTGLGEAEAWAALERATVVVRELVVAADGLDTDAVRAPHPAFGELRFVQWIAFVGWHEARHAAQIRATAAALAGGPGPRVSGS